LKIGGSHLLELPDEDHQHSEMKDARELSMQSTYKQEESKIPVKSGERSKLHSKESKEPNRKDSRKGNPKEKEDHGKNNGHGWTPEY
jgi:hypothetical protein